MQHMFIELSVSLSLSVSESDPQAFGVPLSQVIFNDRRLKQLHEGQRCPAGRPSSLWHLAGRRSNNKELSSSNSSLSSASETPNESSSPSTPETALRSQRRVQNHQYHHLCLNMCQKTCFFVWISINISLPWLMHLFAVTVYEVMMRGVMCVCVLGWDVGGLHHWSGWRSDGSPGGSSVVYARGFSRREEDER